MTPDQLHEALCHFGSRRPLSDPYDHMLELGEHGRRFGVDVQQVCATAMLYLQDMEHIKAAYEQGPDGRAFIGMMQEVYDLRCKVKELQDRNDRQAQLIASLEKEE